MATQERVRDLNDRARRTFQNCHVVITPGIDSLDDVHAVLRQVQQFNDFTEHNDPFQEHDFGSFQHQGHVIFWKWDYYDLDMSMHSPDPSDPAVTARVLTVMLADEY
ncbi:hypothetical protein RAZWK3B_11642 [Roseobacter sp. AzwK-3b]|uniref:DUF3768 domain-containing protein n=1 Tax=Roseobacter sp. AzwK-3b TaxID=351016 RepID=UPI000156A1B4|nr:DUF3768 domain-containing protein [Roseobacter sp. AzwK-3b]EDM69389.1 hypothetical protein RAZWK3B_11642 [Roseobacter sp. AzwK-3b]